MEPPRYMILGGEVFDEIVTAPPEIQQNFLLLLTALRRDPRSSDQLDIEPTRAWGEGAAYMAALEGLDVSYYVVETDAVPRVVLVSALWVGLPE